MTLLVSLLFLDLLFSISGVQSALYGLILSLVICVAAVAVFTTHILLLLPVLLTILGMGHVHACPVESGCDFTNLQVRPLGWGGSPVPSRCSSLNHVTLHTICQRRELLGLTCQEEALASVVSFSANSLSWMYKVEVA